VESAKFLPAVCGCAQHTAVSTRKYVLRSHPATPRNRANASPD
jgi:hypothetical protein